MSNALLVTGKESKTGKPLAVMGPQTGYYAPQMLVEQVLNGPGIQARGVAFAGVNLFVQLGRGVDYAWSATSAGSDNIDTVAEKLCNTDGSRATRQVDRLPGRQEVRPDAVRRPLRDDHAELHRARPRAGPTSSRCCGPGTASSRSGPRSAASRSRWCSSGRRTATRSTRCSASASSTTRASCTTRSRSRGPRATSTTRSTGSTPTPRTSPTTPPGCCRSGRRRSSRTCRTGPGRSTTGRAGCRPRSTRARPTRSAATWSAGTTSRRPDFSAADDTWSYGAVYRSLALEKRLTRQDQRQEEGRPARHWSA